VIAGFAFSVSLIFMGLVDAFAAGLVDAALVGGASAGFQSMNNSLALTLTDLEHHGRVQSADEPPPADSRGRPTPPTPSALVVPEPEV